MKRELPKVEMARVVVNKLEAAIKSDPNEACRQCDELRLLLDDIEATQERLKSNIASWQESYSRMRSRGGR